MVIVEARLAVDGDAQTPAPGAIARVFLAPHPTRGRDTRRGATGLGESRP
jgi:hypothetical protein